MFLEGEVEIKVKDRTALNLSAHDMKLWVRSAYRSMSCYSLANFHYNAADKVVRATVTLHVPSLAPSEQELIAARPNDTGLFKMLFERLFQGKGSCRCTSEPKLHENFFTE